MKPTEILQRLEETGTVYASSDKIWIETNRPVPAQLVEAAREHKQELLQLLSEPRIDAHGRLIISSGCDPKYHWWAGGQSIRETLHELNAPAEVAVKYVDGGDA